MRALIFRTPKWVVALCALATLFMPLAALQIYTKEGSGAFALAAAVLALFVFLGLIDALLTRVVVAERDVEIFSNFKRRSFDRSTISSVAAEKGCPIFLRLREGETIKLPSVVAEGHDLAGVLQAWLLQPTDSNRSAP